MKINSSDIFVIKSIFKSDIFHGIFSTKSARNSKIWFENKSIAFTNTLVIVDFEGFLFLPLFEINYIFTKLGCFLLLLK